MAPASAYSLQYRDRLCEVQYDGIENGKDLLAVSDAGILGSGADIGTDNCNEYGNQLEVICRENKC